MTILKLGLANDNITLEKGNLVEITHDERTRKLPKDSFIRKEFQIVENVFVAENSLIMTKALKADPSITALYCRHGKNHIVIVPPRSYVFFAGRSVEVSKFSLFSFVIPSDRELGL